MSYYWGYKYARYGYVCYIVGSAMLFVGLMLCSHTIEGSTTEDEFVQNPERSTPMHLIRLQRETVVSDQRYSSYLIGSDNKVVRILVSKINNKDFR